MKEDITYNTSDKGNTAFMSVSTPLPFNRRGMGVGLLELLSPAKTASIGIEAIRHGADAVYIGATSFGARAAAGNSVEDIAQLVEFAHQYRARVYVTINTIIYDNEVEEVERLIWKLWEIKVDALIIQDMRILAMNLPPIPLHASTQMDNRTVEKVKMLSKLGFPQVVLARELTVEQISEIHEACPDTELEVFVHGALCVSLSGRCNASEAMFGRSANRGECAQLCRMQYELLATTPPKPENKRREEKVIKRGYLLSLKDNCQLDNLESLILAGATSFKIEGRLKDVDYVKNVTAAYSKALDAIIAKYPGKFYRRASGHVNLKFEPNVYKSFNRGFVKNVNKPEANFYTPKSMGEPLKTLSPALHRNGEGGRLQSHPEGFSPRPYGREGLHNGDGLCYIDKKGELKGFRIGNVDKFVPTPGIMYYRNQDAEWDKIMSHPSAERKINVDIIINEQEVKMTDEDGFEASVSLPSDNGRLNFELARTHQRENIERQLTKLGDTIFEAHNIDIQLKKNYFIPSSLLSQWRRELCDILLKERTTYYPQVQTPHTPTIVDRPVPFEQTHDKDTPLMICHHCIRRQLNMCLKMQNAKGKMLNQLYLRLSNGAMFKLEFDCKNCLMKLYQA